ncbi:MAG TPA: DUF2635 domain-containing protein [Acetobacteraceae bacterium]|nr:DUF2635 domain-containing protein [Acetobacteraceae bacterium]
MFVKPAPGRRVRDPVTRRPLPDGGAEVVRNRFWIRRLRDQDVMEAEPAAQSEKTAPEPAETAPQVEGAAP